jgi:hypothetical protein
LKPYLALVFAGCSLLWGGVEEARYSEIRLQGELSFSDIVNEAESQLGIKIDLPEKINNNATEKYNQIISLKQLTDAVISHFAQDNIPLNYNFEAKTLLFFRLDQVKTPPKTTSKTPTREPSPKYPVPVIHEPAPKPLETPRLPDWLDQRQTSASQNSALNQNIQKLPSQNPRKPPTPTFDDLDSLPTITRSTQKSPRMSDSELDAPFSVRIPSNNSIKIAETPRMGIENSGRTEIRTNDSRAQPSFQEQNRSPNPVQNHTFGIAPYPEDAVAFINDAPSIVPGASKENFVEWSTRMQGLLKNGHSEALEVERKELERRLRWLRDHR